MRAKLAVLAVAIAIASATSAAASGGPVILAGAFGGVGVVGGEPGAEFNYVVLGHKHSIVERISTDDGVVDLYRDLEGEWALPAVTVLGAADGLSADGRTLVLTDQYADPKRKNTHFRILNAHTLKTRDLITLPGTWGFDAISPDGGLMYLVRYRDPKDPLDYRVRQYDLRGGVLRGGALVDLDEPNEKMTGMPMARVTGADGAEVYTLYTGGSETFIHALHTEIGQADCIDIEAIRPNEGNPYALDLAIDPETGVVTVLRRARPVAVVDPETLEAHDSPVPALADAIGRGGAGSAA